MISSPSNTMKIAYVKSCDSTFQLRFMRFCKGSPPTPPSCPLSPLPSSSDTPLGHPLHRCYPPPDRVVISSRHNSATWPNPSLICYAASGPGLLCCPTLYVICVWGRAHGAERERERERWICWVCVFCALIGECVAEGVWLLVVYFGLVVSGPQTVFTLNPLHLSEILNIDFQTHPGRSESIVYTVAVAAAVVGGAREMKGRQMSDNSDNGRPELWLKQRRMGDGGHRGLTEGEVAVMENKFTDRGPPSQNHSYSHRWRSR